MSNAESKLARSLGLLVREARQTESGDHPTPEELTAYHADELPPARDEEIQEHLVLCRECPQLLLALDDFYHPTDSDAGVSDAGVAAAWRELSPRLRQRGRAPAVHRSRVAALVDAFFRPAVAWSVAAALLAATLGLSVYVASLSRTVEGLDEPVANLTVVPLDLSPRRSAEGETEPLEVPGRGERYALALYVGGAPEFPEYRLEILKEDDRSVLSLPGLYPLADGTLSIGMTRKLLPPGTYRFRLFGVQDGEEERAGEIRVRVRYR